LSEDLFRLDDPTSVIVKLARSEDPSRVEPVMRGAS